MMIDPVQAFAAASSVGPIPTVIPNIPIYEHVTKTGSTILWVVFVIMFLSSVAFMVMAWRVPVSKRLFPILTAFITTFATISYFAMATGDGNSYTKIVIREVHKHVPDTYQQVFRQVFWARYLDWTVTTPLLLLDLAFLAGLNGGDILVAVVADLVMALTGLFATFGHGSGQKWGYYAMACVAYLIIVYLLAVNGRRSVMSKSAGTAKFFAAIGGYTLVLWTLYPIVWGFGDGSRILSVDGEILAYAVLDVLAKPVFGFWLLIVHARNPSKPIEGFWSHGLDQGVHLNDDEA